VASVDKSIDASISCSLLRLFRFACSSSAGLNQFHEAELVQNLVRDPPKYYIEFQPAIHLALN
jgi:hypothetical protein